MLRQHLLSARFLLSALLLAGPAAKTLGATASTALPGPTPEDVRRAREAARDPALDRLQRELVRRRLFEAMAGSGEGAASRAASGEEGIWRRIPSPIQRGDHAAIYDPLRDRVVVFGGGDWWNGLYDEEVWTISLSGGPTWTRLDAQGPSPGTCLKHTAIYDPLRDRMIVYAADVWELTLGNEPTWTKLAPAGASPSTRWGHTAIYDPERDRMVMFGGISGGTPLNDVWELSLGETPAWTPIQPAGTPPSERYDHTAIYDPVRDQMVVVWGSEVWALSLGDSPTWTRLAPEGTPPSVLSAGRAVYDPEGDRLIAFGGRDANNEVWALSLSGPTWTRQTPIGPMPVARYRHAVVHDPVRDRLVILGGETQDDISLKDVWALSLVGGPEWAELGPAGTPPPPRDGHAAIYDPGRGRVWVYGGMSFGHPSGLLDDVWTLAMDGTPPTWSRIQPSGASPGDRRGHSAIFDPASDRMVMFGGLGSVTHNDVWTLGLDGASTWTPLAPSGVPPCPRHEHAAVYDPVRDRMMVIGGTAGLDLDDVWALSLGDSPTWTQLVTEGAAPPARHGHTAIYDPLGDQIIVYGGMSQYSDLDDVWSLSLAGTPTWTQLAPEGVPPSARYGHTSVYDPVRHRMVVFGGCGVGSAEVWALSLASQTSWAELAPDGRLPRWRCLHAAIYDKVRDQMVAFGGGDADLVTLNDTWVLQWWDTTLNAPHTPERSALFHARPHPMRPGGRIAFDLAQGGAVQLRVYDLGGRLVENLVDGPMAAGRHEIPWNGAGLAAGVYYLEMRTGALRQVQRLVVLQ